MRLMIGQKGPPRAKKDSMVSIVPDRSRGAATRAVSVSFAVNHFRTARMDRTLLDLGIHNWREIADTCAFDVARDSGRPNAVNFLDEIFARLLDAFIPFRGKSLHVFHIVESVDNAPGGIN